MAAFACGPMPPPQTPAQPPPATMPVHIEVTSPVGPVAGVTARLQNGLASVYATCTTAAVTGRCTVEVPATVRSSGLRLDAPAGFVSRPDFPVEVGPGATLAVRLATEFALPTRAEVLGNLKADICLRDEGDTRPYPGTGTWEALSWDDGRFAAFARKYRDAGHRLLVASPRVIGYLGVTFDYTTPDQWPTLIARLERAHRAGLIVMLDISTHDEGQAVDMARLSAFLAAIKGHVAAVFTGWEIRVDGGVSLWSGPDHLRAIELAREILGSDVVIGVEFLSPETRTEPIVYDGRVVPAGEEALYYWTKTAARHVDVLMLELPYSIVDDPKQAAAEVGGVLCRLQGLFEIPTHWPDGAPIPEDVKANWRTTYHLNKRVMVFEYASYLRWSSPRKRALRDYLYKLFPTLAGYGEGQP